MTDKVADYDRIKTENNRLLKEINQLGSNPKEIKERGQKPNKPYDHEKT